MAINDELVEITVEIMSGPDDGTNIQLKRSAGDGSVEVDGTWVLKIGRRQDDCDIALPFDTMASRVHAHLIYDSGQWYLEDRESRNGTYIGKERVRERVALEEGTLFRVGRTWLSFGGFKPLTTGITK